MTGRLLGAGCGCLVGIPIGMLLLFLISLASVRAIQTIARSTGAQGSEILTSMSKANAFLIVDEHTRRIEAGGMVRALMLDWPEEVF